MRTNNIVKKTFDTPTRQVTAVSDLVDVAIRKGRVLFFLLFASISAMAQLKPAADLTKEEMTALVRRHFETLNIQGPVERLKEMGAVYAKDFYIADTYFEFFNYKGFNTVVSQIHSKYPGQAFVAIEEVQTLHNIARVSWKLGDSLAGLNYFVFRNGKIKDIYAFVSPVRQEGRPTAVNQEYCSVVDKHFETLNVTDSVKRLQMMGDVYTKDFHIVDTYFEHFNYKDWNSTVNVIQQKFPGQAFSTVEVKTIPNIAYATWKLGDSLNGQNLFIIKNGKVRTIIAFVQPVSK